MKTISSDCKTHISDDDPQVVRNQKVCWFDVSMNETSFMEILPRYEVSDSVMST